MKKAFWVLPVALLFSVLSAGNAMASFTWDPVNFTIATYKADQTTPTSQYHVGDTAYLLVNLPAIGALTLVNTFWNDSTPSQQFVTNYNNSSIPGNVFWITGPTFTAANAGNWNINANYTNVAFDPTAANPFTVSTQSKTLRFAVVTPEPAAMMLYGIGGLPLAFAFFRRRKIGAAV